MRWPGITHRLGVDVLEPPVVRGPLTETGKPAAGAVSGTLADPTNAETALAEGAVPAVSDVAGAVTEAAPVVDGLNTVKGFGGTW
jgi:hypothetical protein